MKDMSQLRGRLTITPVEAGAIAFGWAPQTCYNKISKGKFPPIISEINGKKVVRIVDLENYIDNHEMAVVRTPKKTAEQ